MRLELVQRLTADDAKTLRFAEYKERKRMALCLVWLDGKRS